MQKTLKTKSVLKHKIDCFNSFVWDWANSSQGAAFLFKLSLMGPWKFALHYDSYLSFSLGIKA